MEKMKIQMYPDYGDALFWDEEGCCIGDYENIWIGENEIDLSSIDGLKEWFDDWDTESLYQTHHWTDAQWREWWAKGLEFAKAVNELLPTDVDLYYISLKDPIFNVRPEDTNDGGLFNEGEPIKLLKAGTYIFECYPMPWTEIELGIIGKNIGNNPIEVSLDLSYEDIQAIVDMINWAWDNEWLEHSTSETAWTELLQKHIPQLYNKIQPLAHHLFCTKYPNSDHLKGFGEYEIFCPDEIVEFTGYSSKDYYLK